MAARSNIIFYTAFSPNGHKVAITLEELGLSYEMVAVDLPGFQHKEPWYLAINPNGRIPALSDTLDDGKTINIFESGSIQQYLVERYDTEHKISYPRGTKEFFETNNWLFFQNAGIGPMQGQASHFVRYNLSALPEQYARDRYINETRRLYRTLDKHFSDARTDYLVGDKCTIADISISSWANGLWFAGLSIDEFPHVKAWQERMAARPAFQKGSNTPQKVNTNSSTKEEQGFEAIVKKNKGWIQHLMEQDAKR